MKTVIQLIGLGTLLLVAELSAHSAFDSCTSAFDCPGSTSCRCNGPDGYQCRCEDGFTVDERGGHECIKAVKLLEPCDINQNKCVPVTTYCSQTSGLCECLPEYRLTEDNSTCAAPNTREIGESCSSNDQCAFLESCNQTTGVCECWQGLRLRTQEETDANPDAPNLCIPADFDLNSPVHCPVTTTLPTPSTSTVTTVSSTVATESSTDTTTSSTDTTASSTDTTASSTDTTASSTDTTASSTDAIASSTTSTEPTNTDTASTTDSTASSTTETSSTTTLSSNDARVFDACSNDAECPLDASCRTKSDGCGTTMCLCNVGYVASADNTTCLGKSMIGETCSQKSDCLARLSYCDRAEGVCRCRAFRSTRETSGLRPGCTFSKRYFLEETPPATSRCQDNAVPGTDGKCQCISGYRGKTDEEFWEDPDDPVECVLNVTENCDSTSSTEPPSTTAGGIVIRGKLIGETCYDDLECPIEAVCQERGCAGRVCVCEVNHVASLDGTTCSHAYLIGENCSKNSECLARLSYCDRAEGVCKCTAFTRPTSGFRPGCTFSQRYFLGETASSSSRCQDPNAVPAQNGTCVCNIDYRYKTNEEFWQDPYDPVECVLENFSLKTCVPPTTQPTTITTTTVRQTAIRILDVCGRGTICPRNAVCTARACGPPICLCSVGFVPASDGLSCVAGKLIGETCSEDSDCVSNTAYCDGTCKCHAFSQPTSRGTCVRRFFNRKPLREDCRSDRDCLDRGSACLDGECGCIEGLREKSELELWNDIKDSRECVPRTFQIGCPNN